MKIIRHKSLSTRAWLVAQTPDDMQTLKFLYKEKIVWGFYSLWSSEFTGKTLKETELSHRIPDMPDQEDDKILKHIQTTFPDAVGLGFLSFPRDYLSMNNKKED